jgi:DNA-binding transcriptional LysR family regulator
VRHAAGVELDWLRTFLAVVDRGGFSAAAGQVHRSQSRVSAHIAALERELGATLIDRTHRPARLTRAGEVLAAHTREILGAVGSARSAVGAARDLDGDRLTLLTTPCLAESFLPGPLGRVAAACPGARFALLEDGRHDVERRFLDGGVALAVLPVLAAPAVPGLREHPLWQEPLRAVVPVAHRFAALDGPVPADELAGEPLVLAGASGDGPPEALDLLARSGVVGRAAVTADGPGTVGALVRAGLGVGLLTEVAAGVATSDGKTVAVALDAPGLARRVGVYWYDVLLTTEVGRTLHREVLAAPPPPGCVPARTRADRTP